MKLREARASFVKLRETRSADRWSSASGAGAPSGYVAHQLSPPGAARGEKRSPRTTPRGKTDVRGGVDHEVVGPVHLVMGPWIHGCQNEAVHGQVDFGAEAAISDVVQWRLEWLDR